MKKYLLITILFVFSLNISFSQKRMMYCYPVLNDYVEQNLFQEALDDIFAKDSLSNSDIYNLAICYSNLGDFEKAQKNLMDFIKKVEYNLTPAIFLDYRISALRESNYWENVYQLLIEKFLYESGPITDTALAIKIMEHGILDQKYRGLIITQPSEVGENGDLKFIIAENVDSINTIFLDSIVQKYGWPTFSMVGKIAGDYAFLFMQHSDKTSFKKHLGLMEEAVKNNEADKFRWATAYDRYRLYRGKRQIYGTQYRCRIIDGVTQPCELAPTKQKRKVNERRKEFGFTTTVEEEIEKHNKNKVTFYK